MNKKFTKFIAAIALLVFMTPTMAGWGQTTVASFSRSGTSNTTTGGTFTTTFSAKTGYYQDNTGDCYMQILNTNAYWTTTPTSISFAAKIGGGTGNKDLANPVYVSLLDQNGDVITSTQTSVTSYITSSTGDDYTITIPATNNVFGVKLSHEKESGYNVRYYSFSLSYVAGGNTPTTYTVTYDANGGTGTMTDSNSPYNAGATVTVLDNAFTRDNYTFDHWNTSADDSGTSYDEGDTFTINANTTLYAQWTESSGGDDLTATLDVEEYADANNWVNGTKYVTAIVAPVTFTANGGSNTGKYYTAGEEWRYYQTENASITISVSEGYTLTSVKPTYSVSNTGILKNGNSSVASGSTVTVSGTSVTFTVGNSGSATNGQVKFTHIDVTYVSDGSTQITSDLAITNASTDLTFDLYNNSTAQVINYMTSSTGAITITPATSEYFSYVHDAQNKTITVTPTAVTPSAQTVTINQEADDDYYAGSASFTVSVANSAPLANIASLTALTVAGTYNVTLSNAVVTYVNGSNAYIQDASGAVVYHKSDHGLTAGDVLTGTATVSYQLYNGNPQITNLSGVTPVSGTAPDPTSVAQSAWNYTFSNVLSQYFQITGATITQSSNKYYVSLGGESIQLYKSGGALSGLDLTKTYTINGFPTLYNSTKELTIYADPTVEATTEPTITVTPATINAPFAGADGTLALAYENIENFNSFDYSFCDANGDALQGDAPDWIDAEIREGNDTYSLYYVIGANDGEARTAYMKVYTFDDNEDEVYAIVTVNQAQYVVDYAELPFDYNGGLSGIEDKTGLTQNGLGSDYSSAPYLKFNDTGDWVILKINERPGTLSFDIKGNSFSGGTFKVQISENGNSYTDLWTYTDFGTNGNDLKDNETFTDLGENVRYIKWIYTEKVQNGGNVGLGDITLAKYVAPAASITVTPDVANRPAEASAGEDWIEGTLDITYTNLSISDMMDFYIQYYDDEENELNGEDEPDWIVALVAEQDPEIGEGYVVSYILDENDGPARTAYFKVYALDEEAELVYSNLVTITQAAYVAPPTPGSWVLTSLTDLTEDDIFVIVGDDGDTYAMANNGGGQSGAPAAVAVTVVNETLSGEIAANLQWNLGVTNDGYIFYPNGSTTDFLYCINNNNGLRIGTGDGTYSNIFVLDEGTGYMKTTIVSIDRYIGIYNSQDWRCYKLDNGNIQSNIAGQTFAFYKKVVEPATETYTLTVNGYTDVTEGTNNQGYCLIASPVTVDPDDVDGMTDGDFDLYYYNQSEANEWRNYETTTFNLVPGTGYLYAKKATTENSTYSFDLTGTPYSGDGKIDLVYDANAELAGFNLIGNPYAETANLPTGLSYYTLNGEGSDLAAGTATTIDAMKAIFVKATASGQSVQFTPSRGGSTTADNAILALNIGRKGNIIDRAIVRFDEGNPLPKFQLFKNSTKVYIPVDGEDYAVVRGEEVGAMPVNFKAENNGTYSLSLSSENVEFAYLHLVDNMTGADIDLLQTPSYTFEAKTTDYESRFKLVFATGENSNSDMFAFFSNGSFVINNEGNATLQVIDVTGRIVKSESINGCANVNVNATPGVYMLRLVNGDNVKVQKVVVK